MRVLIENGCPRFANVGDIVQLQVTLARLGARWPDAELAVITETPELLPEYCPGAEPVEAAGRDRWVAAQQTRWLSERARRQLGLAAITRLELIEDATPQWWKAARYHRHVARANMPVTPRHHWEAFHDQVRRADMLVFAGGGYLTDTFAWSTRCKLQTLAWAAELNKPVVMFGQGLGPLERPRHLRMLRRALEHVRFVALREAKESPPLLAALGYDLGRSAVTGDDAIEPAYLARPAALGGALGASIRCAAYAQVEKDMAGTLLEVIHRSATRLSAPIEPVVISPQEDSTNTDGPAKAGETMVAADRQSEPATRPDPAGTIAAAGRCRVVVTGTYHAAVFALSQGVSVVGLTRSAYYRAKFQGLAAQFSAGCTLIELEKADAAQQLATAIDRSWEAAPAVRPALLAAACHQRDAGLAAYRRGLDLAASGIPPAR